MRHGCAEGAWKNCFENRCSLGARASSPSVVFKNRAINRYRLNPAGETPALPVKTTFMRLGSRRRRVNKCFEINRRNTISHSAKASLSEKSIGIAPGEDGANTRRRESFSFSDRPLISRESDRRFIGRYVEEHKLEILEFSDTPRRLSEMQSLLRPECFACQPLVLRQY
jgi:hypothetical protein